MEHHNPGLPLFLIVLAAGFWTFWRAAQRPPARPPAHWQRIRSATIEGSICAATWMMIQMGTTQVVTMDAVQRSVLAGLAWAGTVWWSTRHYELAAHHALLQANHPTREGPLPSGRRAPSGMARRDGMPPISTQQVAQRGGRATVLLGGAGGGRSASLWESSRLNWSVRIGYPMIAVLSGLGAALFWVHLLGWSPPWSTRPALVLQLAASTLLGVFVFTRWRPSARIVSYPLILALIIYLWDTTLPPPTLPHGPLRHGLPLLIYLGVIADLMLTIRAQRLPRPSIVQIRHGVVTIEDAALLLGLRVTDLRQRLHDRGQTTSRDQARETISLADLQALEDDDRPQNGRVSE